jgi:glycosyltransferase involved in cell wall biosynthesis
MKVNISVCGRFHFHNYVRYLAEHKILNAFYYSHKRETDFKNLHLPEEITFNFPLKEYMVQLQGRLLKSRAKGITYPLFFNSWQSSVLKKWKPAELYHYVNHGNSLKLIQRAKQDNMLVLGECVNSHIDYMRSILHEEYELLGLKERPGVYSWEKKMLEELNHTDHILAPSGFVKKTLTDKGFNADKIHTIPYGANLSRFYPSENIRQDKTFRVIMVAQLNPRKGHKYLLEAWKRLKLPDAELVLIGAMRPEMEQVLKPYKGLYTYKGVVPNHELIKYFHESDLFVMPSIEEGCSVAPLEAMACGLPVIISENTGADAYFKDGEHGYIVPIRNIDILSEKILFLYNNPELRRQISIKNIAATREDLSWSKYSERLINLYNELLILPR